MGAFVCAPSENAQKMKMSLAVLTVVAFIGSCAALPYVEESWHAEDELLARVFEDSAPMSELLQSPASIKHAEDTAAAESKAAEKAAKKEGTQTKKEEEYEEKAASLGEKMKNLEKANARANAKAKEDEDATAAKYLKEGEDATKATADAEKKNTELQAQYTAEEAQLKKDGAAASDASKARIAETKKKLDASKEKVADEEKAQEDLSIKQEQDTAKQQADLKEADEDYTSKIKADEKERKEAEDGFKKEGEKYENEARKAIEEHKASFKKKKEELAKEKENNDAMYKAEKAEIEKADEGAQTALKIANAAENKKKRLVKKKEQDRRAGVIAEAEKKKTEADNEFKVAMKKADDEKADAKKAKGLAATAVKRSEEDQKDMDKSEEDEDEEDAAMKSCATDGSECQKCVAVKNKDKEKCECIKVGKKGPYIGEDLISCSDVKTAADSDPQDQTGNDWAGIDAPLEKSPEVARDQAKCDKIKNGATGILKEAFKVNSDSPMVSVACNEAKVTFAARKAALLSVFDAGENCLPYCFPGTATETDNGVADTNGICLDADAMDGFKWQITDMPSYKAMGTNNKIPAGPPADLCRMAKNLVCGMTGGAGQGGCPKVDTSVPFPDEKK